MSDNNRIQRLAERVVDDRRVAIGLRATFEFVGGPMDGEQEAIPLSWLTCRISGTKYTMAVIENRGSDPPLKYVLVHESMVPKEQRG